MCMTAGHTASWGKGYPELLTDCYDAQERPTGLKGPVNPARNETYALLWQLLREAAAAFPDSYIHLGGDEVPFDCWQVLLPLTFPPGLCMEYCDGGVLQRLPPEPPWLASRDGKLHGNGGYQSALDEQGLHICVRGACKHRAACRERCWGAVLTRVCNVLLQSSPEIKAFMAENGLKSVSELETYFEGRVLGLARQAGRNYIVWQVSVIHLRVYHHCPSCMLKYARYLR